MLVGPIDRSPNFVTVSVVANDNRSECGRYYFIYLLYNRTLSIQSTHKTNKVKNERREKMPERS